MAAHNGSASGRSAEQSDDRPGPTVPLTDSPPTDLSPGALRALAFWAAVVLPFLHVPLLTTGLASPAERRAFLVLLTLNAAALYAGHSYGRD